MNKKLNKKKKGFTLIELVIVLAVLAIIALIAIPNFTKVRNDSLRKADEQTAKQLEKITLMAIANEDIVKKGTIKVKDAKALTAEENMFKTESGETSYKDMISEVSKPQQKDFTYFEVVIDDNMSVDVKAVTKTS